MAPLSTTIVGTAFSKRVMDGISRRRPFAIGLRNHEKGAIIEEMKTRHRFIYSLDYSGFDSSIPAEMIDDAFGVARTYLDLDKHEKSVWDRYVNDFIHSRLVSTLDGQITQKHRGIPSGSAFTSIIGSIVNLILAQYMWIRATGHGLATDQMFILGDDILIASNTQVKPALLARYAAELGFTVSTEKSSVRDGKLESPDAYTNQVHFLGHYWVHGLPRRPVKELVQRMVYPERHARRSRGVSLLRLLSYTADAREGFEIFRLAYPGPRVLSEVFRLLNDIGDESDELLTSIDLPGNLRYRRDVEGTILTDSGTARGLSLFFLGQLL